MLPPLSPPPNANRLNRLLCPASFGCTRIALSTYYREKTGLELTGGAAVSEEVATRGDQGQSNGGAPVHDGPVATTGVPTTVATASLSKSDGSATPVVSDGALKVGLQMLGL